MLLASFLVALPALLAADGAADLTPPAPPVAPSSLVPAPARLGEVVVVGGNSVHRGLGHAALRGRSPAVVVGDVTVVVDRLLEHIQRRGSPVASAAPDQQFDHVLRHHAAQ